MREVAVPSNFPSAGKNLINFIVKVPVGLFAITIGQIPAVKRKTWDNLEKVHLVSSSLGKTLLDLAIHVYKAIMFLTFSPIWCFTVGTFSPKFCKTVLDKMHLTKSEGPQQENPKTEADSTEVPLSSDSQASQSSETQQASQSNSDVSGADQAPSSQQTMTANSINHTVLRMNAENKDQSQEQNEAQGQENKKEMRKSVIQQKPASHSTSSANRLSMKPMQSGLSFWMKIYQAIQGDLSYCRIHRFFLPKLQCLHRRPQPLIRHRRLLHQGYQHLAKLQLPQHLQCLQVT
ncbi:MAG: hypothetical protein HWD61_00785 [Parachlamydiaceae bacterium]|nr:MAG: hypothetical protein HWD61_00785 [Parachlamydiaceae bacterium]